MEDKSYWDNAYIHLKTPWISSGLSQISKKHIKTYAQGSSVLEVGCGYGHDLVDLYSNSLNPTGIDISDQSIEKAKKITAEIEADLVCDDFIQWENNKLFDIVYDKGVYHNLQSPAERDAFCHKVSSCLNENGLWHSIIISSDRSQKYESHAGIFLQDFVSIVEAYFQILDIQKGLYGLRNSANDVDSWYCSVRRR
ncbi:class I SAM-dependent methyltransferase [Terasakiella sp. SH-1]|uniref:class I SAM-dependent methyltransferase n=1 Tax=Terasakiella sp. SH-1 TaxID=2560057 RepID=UPI00107318ED|nr:class I SAM-dependent methyltransferase [Terasakiella sp. SH-1]